MGNVNNIFKLFPNYFDLQSNKDFIKYCLTDFYFIPVVFLINTIHYIRTKKYLSLAIFLAFFFGYLFLVNVSYYAGTHQFYIENLYLPLGLILAVPFVYDFLPSLRNQKLAFGIILAMLLIRVVHIGLCHEKFTARLNWHKKLLGDTSQLPNKKLLINAAEVPIDTLFMTWCTSYELLLLSAIDKPEEARLIQIDEEPHRYDWQLYMNKAFLTEWKEVEFKDLPHRYFNPTDTSQYIHYSLKP